MLLRIAEQTERIHHIPQILYHWRELSTSTASHLDAKPYVLAAQKAVLQDCYNRRGIAAVVERNRYGHYQPIWKKLSNPLVSIIIPSRNQPKLIRQLLHGLLSRTLHRNLEIVIVDNQSTDPSVFAYYSELKAEARVRVIEYAKPFNYSAACNRGAAVANGEYLLFLNNDIEIVHENWLDELLGWGEQPDVGIAGGHLLYPDGRTQHAGVVLGLYELAGHVFSLANPETSSPFGMAEWTRNVSAVTGACQLMRRSTFQSLGGYDETYTLVYSDLDLCLRIHQLGLRVVYAPSCRLIHHECATREPGNNKADTLKFAEILRQYKISEDPYYHPALSAHGRVPQLKSQASVNVHDNLAIQLQQHLKADNSPLFTMRKTNLPRRAA